MSYEPYYFSWSEFDQKGIPCSGKDNMDRDFVKWLDDLRGLCGFPFFVTSAYRSPEYNSQVSSTGPNGPHTTGKAVDIAVKGDEALTVIKHATELGVRGLGVKQKGPHSSRFIHLDMLEDHETKGPRPWVWSY